jgi:hypothetical protein
VAGALPTPARPGSRWTFAADVLDKVNVTTQGQAGQVNIVTMLAWQKAEGTSAKFNPYATTQREQGSTTLPGNSSGVQEYTSFDQGVQATAATLQNGSYGPILAALRSGAGAQAVAQAVGRSPWGTDGQLMGQVAAGWGNGQGAGVIQSIGYGGSNVPGVGGSIGVGDIPVVGGIVHGVASTATSVASFLGALTERSTWLRVAEIIAGLALGLGGLFLLGRILIAEQAGSIVGTVAKGALSRGS